MRNSIPCAVLWVPSKITHTKKINEIKKSYSVYRQTDQHAHKYDSSTIRTVIHFFFQSVEDFEPQPNILNSFIKMCAECIKIKCKQ